MNNINMVMLGDIATWVTAVGTIGAFIVAFKQIHTERHERKKRQNDDAESKKRAHAEQLSAWIDGGELHISNSSHHPMHDVEIVLTSGDKYQQKVIAPGLSKAKVSKVAGDHVVSAEFTDIHGERWVKRHGEKLRHLD